MSGSRGVKEASRQAVLKAVDELNYRPNVIAQSLLSQSTGCIGVINHPDTPRRLAQQRLRNHIGPVVQFIYRFQNGLTAGFLYATRPTQQIYSLLAIM